MDNPRIGVTRRSLLRVGGLGMLGLTLPQLLSARESMCGPNSRRSRDLSCILVVQYGGASHIDTWDVKPDAPEEIRGPYKPIATTVPGLRLMAAHMNTTNLIGNGLLALLRHREQRRAFQERPGLVASAAEEILRYDSPVQMITRQAREDLEIGDKKIAKDQVV